MRGVNSHFCFYLQVAVAEVVVDSGEVVAVVVAAVEDSEAEGGKHDLCPRTTRLLQHTSHYILYFVSTSSSNATSCGPHRNTACVNLNSDLAYPDTIIFLAFYK